MAGAGTLRCPGSTPKPDASFPPAGPVGSQGQQGRWNIFSRRTYLYFGPNTTSSLGQRHPVCLPLVQTQEREVLATISPTPPSPPTAQRHHSCSLTPAGGMNGRGAPPQGSLSMTWLATAQTQVRQQGGLHRRPAVHGSCERPCSKVQSPGPYLPPRAPKVPCRNPA